MINIRENLAIDIAKNTAENLLREINLYENISLYRTFQNPQVIKWFDKLLFFSKQIEKLSFYKENKEGEWFLDISYRFTDKKSSPVTYPIIEEIILPFAPCWKKEFENRINEVWKNFWTSSDEDILFQELVEIAIVYAKSIIGKSGKNLAIVCGPISTGPGTIEEKLITFQKAIYLLQKKSKREKIIFDQMPFEDIFSKYHNWLNGKKSNKILTHFYQKIFESKMIREMNFLPGWNFSEGATWERNTGIDLCFDIIHLKEDFVEDFWIKFLHQKTKQ